MLLWLWYCFCLLCFFLPSSSSYFLCGSRRRRRRRRRRFSWSIIEFPSVLSSYFHAQVIATLPRCHIAPTVSPSTCIPPSWFLFKQEMLGNCSSSSSSSSSVLVLTKMAVFRGGQFSPPRRGARFRHFCVLLPRFQRRIRILRNFPYHALVKHCGKISWIGDKFSAENGPRRAFPEGKGGSLLCGGRDFFLWRWGVLHLITAL